MTEKKVLIIEADAALSEEWANGLRDYGFKVAATADPDDGVTKAERVRPDIVLLRVELPNVNGYKVAKTFKEHDSLKDVPLILLSSEASEKDFESHKKTKSRAQAYRKVPVELDDILEDVENLVGLPGPMMAEFQAEAVPAEKYNELEAARAELIVELDRAREQLESKSQAEARLETRVGELESDLVSKAGAGEATKALQAELESLRAELTAIKDERDESRAELDSKKRIINKLKENLTKQEGSLNELTAKVGELEQRPAEDLSPRVKQLEEELADAVADVESKKKVVAKLKENLEKLEQSTAPAEAVATERKLKEEALAEAENLRGDVESKKKVISTLKGKIETTEKDLEAAQQLLKENEEELAAAKKLKDRVAELEKDFAAMKTGREADVSRLKETIADLTIGADEAKRDRQKAFRDRDEAIEAKAALEKQHQKELDALKNHYEPKVAALKSTEKELDKAKEDIRQRDRKLDEEARKLREIEDENAERIAELKRDHQKTITEQERERQKAFADQDKLVAELRSELQQLTDEKKKMEERVVKAYRKLRADESQLEKVRKALEIAMGLAKIEAADAKKKEAG